MKANAKREKYESLALDLVSLVLPDDEAKSVEIMLSPWGDVKSTKGNFVVDDESAKLILDEFAKGKKPIPIDYEHTTLGGNYSTPSGAAPAAGWIMEILAKAGQGIFAVVKWNEAARAMIQADEYRYLSPVLMVRKDDRKAVAVTSAALTNTPAIVDMERVAAKDNDVDGVGEQTMDLKQLKVVLSAAGVELPEGATDETILASGIAYISTARAVNDPSPPLMAMAAKLGLPSNSSLEIVQARIGDLQVNVPAAEYKTVTDRLAKLEGIARDREGQEVIAYAIETAKINPNHEASMVQYRIMAKTDPIAFRRLADSMPALYSVGRLRFIQSALDDDSSANEEKLIAKEIELQKGDKKKALISLQEKLIEEQMSAGLRKDVAITRCKEVHPMIFGGSR